MNLFSVQADAAIIAGVASLSIGLIIALAAIKWAMISRRGFAAESLALEMLKDRKARYRTFRVLKYHLGGFADDELRKILVRAGGIRLTADGQEVWGLLARNRKYVSVEDIKEAPTTQIVIDRCEPQQKEPQQEAKAQDEPDLARQSSEALERVRAEMIKLGSLDCVRSAAR